MVAVALAEVDFVGPFPGTAALRTVSDPSFEDVWVARRLALGEGVTTDEETPILRA